MSAPKAYRAALLHALGDPSRQGAEAIAYHPDGLLVVEDGHVAAAGDYAVLAPELAPGVAVEKLPGALITPGFVDAHVHYPQIDVVGAWGSTLLDWLEAHVFPAERAFADRAHADAEAEVFLRELLRHGTTSALVFGTVHKTSVEALFAAALARDMRLVAGKVLMDRNAPADLLDTAETGRADTEALIRAWRGRGRLGYAVTPRFAPTSTAAQLAMAGEVAAAHPDVLVHTHMAENHDEIARVGALFPEDRDYLAVYERFGLVGPRTVLAHCVHAGGEMLARMAKAGATIAFCPSSNLMLGSGLFSLRRACGCGVEVALGTDIGAGASFSMLAMGAEAYRVGHLRGEPLDPLHGFYLATLAGARALKIDAHVGNFAPGKEADFLVLDLAASPTLARRTRAATSLAETLSVLMTLGDDRTVMRTYVMAALPTPATEPSMPDALETFIRGLPKAELHLHIEGSLEPELMFELARRNRVALPFASVEAVRAAYAFSNLQDFLDIYYQGAGVLLTEQDFHDLAMAYFTRVAADGARHVELFFDPQTHTARGVPFAVAADGLLAGMAEAERTLGVTSRLILSYLRHLPEEDAFETLRAAEPYLDRIAAVGLDSSELGHPPSKFARVFAASRERGLRLVAHAGEEGPPAYVREALDLLHVDRIDHGNRSLEDPALVRRLATEGVTLTVCPLSNLKLRVVSDLAGHPIKQMLGLGLKATINSDDPAYFGGYLADNWIAAARAVDLSRAELVALARNSFTGAFLPAGEIAGHLAEIDAYVGSATT